MPVIVVNKNHSHEYQNGVDYILYIGRPSILGNPFVICDTQTRNEVIDKYLTWLRNEYLKKDKVYSLLNELVERVERNQRVVLECHCKPLKCHGDIIKQAIEAIVVQRSLSL
jgi:hypothetical protein